MEKKIKLMPVFGVNFTNEVSIHQTQKETLLPLAPRLRTLGVTQLGIQNSGWMLLPISWQRLPVGNWQTSHHLWSHVYCKRFTDTLFGKKLDFSYYTQPYFCGHSEECLILGSQWAGQKAKENIDKYFPVVGVLEHFGASLRLFEKILPKYFKGIEKKYQKHENSNFDESFPKIYKIYFPSHHRIQQRHDEGRPFWQRIVLFEIQACKRIWTLWVFGATFDYATGIVSKQMIIKLIQESEYADFHFKQLNIRINYLCNNLLI